MEGTPTVVRAPRQQRVMAGAMSILLLLLSIAYGVCASDGVRDAAFADPTDSDTDNTAAAPPRPVAPSTLAAAARVVPAVVLLLALALLALVYAQPGWAMDLVVRNSHASVLWCVRTSVRVCALTIDDAPSPATPQILDLLRDHGVKATFFIISNNIKGNEEVVRRIVREGHRLGNHLTEDRASILDELHVFAQKLKECDAAIARYQPHASLQTPSLESSSRTSSEHDETDTTPIMPETTERTRLLDSVDTSSSTTSSSSSSSSASSPAASLAPSYGATTCSKWLRPASGWFTSNMREIVLSHGYKICMGSVYPHDAQIKSERLNALYLRLRTRPGAVLIVHDRAWTVGVLREALPELVRKFKFVSLDELSLHHHTHKVKSASP